MFERQLERVTEQRYVTITDVNVERGVITASDSYGTLLYISFHVHEPLLAVPVVGENWVVHRHGHDWFLGKRLELGTEKKPLSTLTAGDRRIEVPKKLHVSDLATFGDDEFPNLEGNTVRIGLEIHPQAPPSTPSSESAGIYVKIDPASVTDQRVGLYGEITANQVDTTGAVSKVVHYGQGDAHYVALKGFGSVSFESATFVDGTKGIISTCQTDGQPYSVLFNALWDQPTVPAYGIYYADASPGHALTVRKRVGAAATVPQIRVISSDLATEHFAVYNDGSLKYSLGTAAPSDSLIGNGQVIAYLDEAGNTLRFRVRYSNGTYKTGSVTLT